MPYLGDLVGLRWPRHQESRNWPWKIGSLSSLTTSRKLPLDSFEKRWLKLLANMKDPSLKATKLVKRVYRNHVLNLQREAKPSSVAIRVINKLFGVDFLHGSTPHQDRKVNFSTSRTWWRGQILKKESQNSFNFCRHKFALLAVAFMTGVRFSLMHLRSPVGFLQLQWCSSASKKVLSNRKANLLKIIWSFCRKETKNTKQHQVFDFVSALCEKFLALW